MSQLGEPHPPPRTRTSATWHSRARRRVAGPCAPGGASLHLGVSRRTRCGELTVRSVEAMVNMKGDVILDLSNVDCIDEIGMNALHSLIQSIHKQNRLARFTRYPG